MEFTPQFFENSFIALAISYVIVFAFQLYMMYLNWKQSRVNDKMDELISEVKAIRKQLEVKKSRK